MAGKPLITVVIPAFNACQYVADAVNSALAQTYRPIEVIVVDDGSSDGTAQLLAGYCTQIRYIYQDNRGLSAARNRGIREGRGQLIAFLDADDKWSPDKLMMQWSCLENDGRVGLVHTDVLYCDDSTGLCFRKNCGRHEFTGNCYPRFFERNAVTPSTVLLRRDCLAKVGMFDEEIRRPSLQDYDLWFRVARHYELKYIPQPLVSYRLHATNASKNLLMMTEDEVYVVERALELDPTLWNVIGKANVKKRLSEMYFAAGYLCFDTGEFEKAHAWFARALACCPISAYAWLLWSSTFLPFRLVQRLRTLKARWRL